jgi:hypothetical protein
LPCSITTWAHDARVICSAGWGSPMSASQRESSGFHRHIHLSATLAFVVVVAVFCETTASAQSNLPPCPSDKNAFWTNCFGTDTSPDGMKYVGEFRDNKFNGHGTMFYPSGSKYVGEWRDGARNGQATYLYTDGSKYVGKFRDDKCDGQGTFLYTDGSKYVGEVHSMSASDCESNGHGTWLHPDGDKYVGEFRDGKFNGHGTYTFPVGDKYVGEWRDGKKNGQGTYTSPDGSTYVGKWSNDQFVENIGISSRPPSNPRPQSSAASDATEIKLVSEGGTFKVPASYASGSCCLALRKASVGLRPSSRSSAVSSIALTSKIWMICALVIMGLSRCRPASLHSGGSGYGLLPIVPAQPRRSLWLAHHLGCSLTRARVSPPRYLTI